MADDTDDQPTDPAADAADEAGPAEKPTEPTDAAAPTATAAASGAAAGGTGSGMTRGVTVPAWLLGVLALVAVGLLGFGIGRWTAPDDNPPQAQGIFPGQAEQGAPEGGPQQAEPQPPTPPAGDSAVLGVAVEESSDPDGAAVVRVSDGGPAADAGIGAGDVITAVDDDEVTTPQELSDAVRSHDPGDEVTVTYERDADSHDADVTLVSADSLRSSSATGGPGGDTETN